jgi:hypothetical protein
MRGSAAGASRGVRIPKATEGHGLTEAKKGGHLQQYVQTLSNFLPPPPIIFRSPHYYISKPTLPSRRWRWRRRSTEPQRRARVSMPQPRLRDRRCRSRRRQWRRGGRRRDLWGCRRAGRCRDPHIMHGASDISIRTISYLPQNSGEKKKKNLHFHLTRLDTSAIDKVFTLISVA